MRDTASESLSKWTNSDQGSRIGARDDLRRLDLEAVMLCLFGEHLDSISGPEQPVVKALDDVRLECMLHPNQPGLLKWLQYQRKLDKGSQTLRRFAAEAVANRRSQPSP